MDSSSTSGPLNSASRRRISAMSSSSRRRCSARCWSIWCGWGRPGHPLAAHPVVGAHAGSRGGRGPIGPPDAARAAQRARSQLPPPARPRSRARSRARGRVHAVRAAAAGRRRVATELFAAVFAAGRASRGRGRTDHSGPGRQPRDNDLRSHGEGVWLGHEGRIRPPPAGPRPPEEPLSAPARPLAARHTGRAALPSATFPHVLPAVRQIPGPSGTAQPAAATLLDHLRSRASSPE